MQKLANLVDPRADTPRPIRGQAWALLAHVYWNRMDFSPSTADPGTQLKELYRAAECANKAFANLTTVSGEVPPLAELFNIAMHIEDCGLRSPKTRADNSPNHAERFADLSYLWAVVDILKAERIMPYSWFEFGVKYVVEVSTDIIDNFELLNLIPICRSISNRRTLVSKPCAPVKLTFQMIYMIRRVWSGFALICSGCLVSSNV